MAPASTTQPVAVPETVKSESSIPEIGSSKSKVYEAVWMMADPVDQVTPGLFESVTSMAVRLSPIVLAALPADDARANWP